MTSISPTGPLLTLRWVLASMMSRATCWAVVAVLALLWPVGRLLAPFQIDVAGTSGRGVFEVAFMASLAGAGFAVDTLTGRGQVFRASSAPQRLLAEAAGVLGGAAACAAPVLLGPLVLGERAGIDLGSLLALGIAAVHVTGIALLVLRTESSSAVRWGLLLSFGWVLPILFVTDDAALGFLSIILGAPLHVPDARGSTTVLSLPALAPIAALWLAACLLGNVRSAKR